MNNAAEQLSHVEDELVKTRHFITLVQGNKTAQAELVQTSWLGTTKSIYLLGSVLILLQVADAFLTILGVHHFGMEAEGNLLLRTLMEHMGYVPALALAKGIAIVIIFSLCMATEKVSWLSNAFLVLIGVYLSAAIIPWSMLLVKYVYSA